MDMGCGLNFETFWDQWPMGDCHRNGGRGWWEAIIDVDRNLNDVNRGKPSCTVDGSVGHGVSVWVVSSDPTHLRISWNMFKRPRQMVDRVAMKHLRLKGYAPFWDLEQHSQIILVLASGSNLKLGWDHGKFQHEAMIWKFPKMVVPLNHPFQ